ncbi:microtubule-associated protein [Salix suchowensis]|nr:microtubule-associated protein [Salix suchowensis]
MPVADLGDMRGRDVGGGYERKVYSREMKKWESEDGEVRGANFAVKRERSVLRSAVAHSAKRKKEYPGMGKDRSVKKKARTAEKEGVAKKRVCQASKTAFTSTSDAKPLEFYEDRTSKSFKGELQGNKNKHSRDSGIQEQESDSYVAVENDVEKPNLAVVEQSSEAMSLDMSRPDSSTGAGLEKEKSCHDVLVAVESSPKESNVLASAQEHNECGKLEGNNMLSGNFDDQVEGSTRGDVPALEVPASASPEVMGDQINVNGDAIPGSAQSNVKVEVDDDNSKGGLNRQSSHGDIKDARISYDNISENSKPNGVALGGSSNDHKIQKVGSNLEAVLLCNTGEANKFSDGPCQHKQAEGSIEIQQCLPESIKGTETAEELSKLGERSGETITSSPALPNQHKIVVCVAKSSSVSSTEMISKTPPSDNFRTSDTLNFSSNAKQQVIPDCNSSIKKDRAKSEMVTEEERCDISKKIVKDCPKSSVNSASKVLHSSKSSQASAPKRTASDSKDYMLNLSSKASSAQNSGGTAGALQIESTSHTHSKPLAPGLSLRSEKFNQSNSQSSSKTCLALSMKTSAPTNSPAALSDEELALLLHQELNSSPRVPRVPRVRHAGGLPHSVSPTTSVLMKRTSSSGAKDHSLASRRKGKDTSKNRFHRYQEPDDEAKKTDRPSSSDQRRQDTGYKANSVSKRGDNGSPTAVNSVKNNIPPTSTSTANSGPSSSTEVNDHHFSSRRNSPRNISDDETGTVRAPVHCTLPGLINEIMSKGRRMTYEELCNAVLPHWQNLRKHNGERYAYSSPSQAVLDCLRNRHEWAQLVDRGPKTNSSRKRRKFDPDESEDNDYGKVRTAKGEGKSLESQREEVPKGKRKARTRRHLALQGRGIKDVRKRRKADILTDDDSGLFSNSSNETLYSEDDSQECGAGPAGSEATASSDDTETS